MIKSILLMPIPFSVNSLFLGGTKENVFG